MPRLIAEYPKAKKNKTNRRYYVEYNLQYLFIEGRKYVPWVGYYRTKLGAYIAIYWNRKETSMGGTAKLYEQDSWKNGQRNERKL